MRRSRHGFVQCFVDAWSLINLAAAVARDEYPMYALPIVGGRNYFAGDDCDTLVQIHILCVCRAGSLHRDWLRNFAAPNVKCDGPNPQPSRL